MSWTKITPTQPGRVTGVSLSILREHSTENCSRVFVSISRHLAEAAGIAYDARVDFFVGEGEDAGRMRIVTNPDGGYVTKGKRKTGSVRVAAAAPKEFPRALRTQKCTVVSAGSDGVVFELPWAQKPESEVMPAEGQSNRSTIPTFDARHGKEVMLPDGTKPSRAADTSPVSATQGDQIAASKALTSLDKPARKANGRFSGKAPPPDPVTPPDAAPISIRSIVEETAPPPAKPAPHPVAQARKPLTYLFTHKGKAVELDPRHHALAERLQKAMGKGFLDYDTLMKGCAISSVEHLHGTVSALRKKIEPLGLDIGPQPKMGYFMKETAGIVG